MVDAMERIADTYRQNYANTGWMESDRAKSVITSQMSPDLWPGSPPQGNI